LKREFYGSNPATPASQFGLRLFVYAIDEKPARAGGPVSGAPNIASKFKVFAESLSLVLGNFRFAEPRGGDGFDLELRAALGSRASTNHRVSNLIKRCDGKTKTRMIRAVAFPLKISFVSTRGSDRELALPEEEREGVRTEFFL
jgi:hypothetical protein